MRNLCMTGVCIVCNLMQHSGKIHQRSPRVKKWIKATDRSGYVSIVIDFTFLPNCFSVTGATEGVSVNHEWESIPLSSTTRRDEDIVLQSDPFDLWGREWCSMETGERIGKRGTRNWLMCAFCPFTSIGDLRDFFFQLVIDFSATSTSITWRALSYLLHCMKAVV